MGTIQNQRLRVVPAAERKARGAFFTPPAIAEFLAGWAIKSDPDARVLDPTCGDGVFLVAAGKKLRELNPELVPLDERVCGIDLHQPSLQEAMASLEDQGLDARLLQDDFFELEPPDRLFGALPAFDAVIGNPPFVRYQHHVGNARLASRQAALRQGVRLSGLASSWAALVVHAGAFLKPEGRLGMVLPAELLTVSYAEPIRRWLRERFEAVRLVLFEKLQFEDALENVVLLLANGWGGCDSFSLYQVYSAEDLYQVPLNELSYVPSESGKWTDLLLGNRQRQLFRRVLREHFVGLAEYGSPELGTVTGANSFFAINETTRLQAGLSEEQLERISPPGTRHLRGLSFTKADWNELRDAAEAVWLLRPDPDDRSPTLLRYVAKGESEGVHEAYKCQIRSPWWRPSVVQPPDLFFTYMSHRYPRLITNTTRVTFLNSMHGVCLKKTAPKIAREALPLIAMNSMTMIGAEIFGRSYGGGILKMEPSEAARLPMPTAVALEKAWVLLKDERASLDRKLRQGLWTAVAAHVDDVLLRRVLQLDERTIAELKDAAQMLRSRRLSRASGAK